MWLFVDVYVMGKHNVYATYLSCYNIVHSKTVPTVQDLFSKNKKGTKSLATV